MYDLVIAVFLFLCALAGYGILAIRLAEGRYSDYLNLAFDFDPYFVLSLLTETPGQTLGFKHPLLLLLRPVGLALVAVGLPAKIAAGLIMATFGAGTVALVWCFLRLADIQRLESFLLTLLFGLSATQMLTSIIPESYGISGFAIALLWCVTIARIKKINFKTDQSTFLHYFSSLVLIGVTITNVVQAFIAELSVQILRGGFRDAFFKTFRFGIILLACFFFLCMIVWHAEIWKAVLDPMGAARQIWWLQTKGPRSGAIEVAKSFMVFSFVAPNYTYVRLPESTNMRDFRDWSFAGMGVWTVTAWLVLAVVGGVCSIANKRFRPVAIGLLAALVFNLAFHLHFQFRGSIFLYAAHAHFLVFALSAGVALFVRDRGALRIGYLSLLAVLVVLFGLNNVPMAQNFSTSFDKPDTSCPAPCT